MSGTQTVTEEYRPQHVLENEPDDGQQQQPPAEGEQGGGEQQPAEGGEQQPAEPTPEERKARDTARRIAQLTARQHAEAARAEAAEARARELETRLARQQAGEQAPPGTPQADIDRLVAQRVAQLDAQRQTQAFHDAGRAELGADKWAQTCTDLLDMGADAQLAELLIELPGGPKVAAALAADPAELQRIAGLRTERGRAVALGQYAERVSAKAAAPKAPPPTSNAPAPIRPVERGRARGEPDPNGSMEEYERWSAKQRWAR